MSQMGDGTSIEVQGNRVIVGPYVFFSNPDFPQDAKALAEVLELIETIETVEEDTEKGQAEDMDLICAELSRLTSYSAEQCKQALKSLIAYHTTTPEEEIINNLFQYLCVDGEATRSLVVQFKKYVEQTQKG